MTANHAPLNLSATGLYIIHHDENHQEDNDVYYDLCEVPYSTDGRWYFVALAGTSLSLVSIVCNMLTAIVLLRRKYAHFYFLGLLAASDTFLSICYGPVIAMDVIKNRLQMLWLTRLYWMYVGPLLSFCHVSMTFSSLMIILGTIERYLITVKSPLMTTWRAHRGCLALSMMTVALMLRGTELLEYTIQKNSNCTGLTEYEPALTELVADYFYGTIYRFYARNILTVFVPFLLLAYLNGCIVITLRRQHRSASMFRYGSSEHKQKIRSATRLLLLIVFGYLIANFLNVLITAWEYIDFNGTQTAFEVYEVLTDVISVMYVFTCASRLPMYLFCNQELRKAFCDVLCRRLRPEKDNLLRRTGKVELNGMSKSSEIILTRSPFGTEFDRITIALADPKTTITPRTSLATYNPPLIPETMVDTMIGSPSSQETAVIISNPLADDGYDDEADFASDYEIHET